MHMLNHLAKEVKFHFQLLTSACLQKIKTNQKLAKYIFFLCVSQDGNKECTSEDKIEKKQKLEQKKEKN